jgi:hypothetical protein
LKKLLPTLALCAAGLLASCRSPLENILNNQASRDNSNILDSSHLLAKSISYPNPVKTLTLEWNPSENATSYELFVGKQSGVYDQSEVVSGTSATISLPSGVYYFSVKANNDSGSSSPSEEIVVNVENKQRLTRLAPTDQISTWSTYGNAAGLVKNQTNGMVSVESGTGIAGVKIPIHAKDINNLSNPNYFNNPILLIPITATRDSKVAVRIADYEGDEAAYREALNPNIKAGVNYLALNLNDYYSASQAFNLDSPKYIYLDFMLNAPVGDSLTDKLYIGDVKLAPADKFISGGFTAGLNGFDAGNYAYLEGDFLANFFKAIGTSLTTRSATFTNNSSFTLSELIEGDMKLIIPALTAAQYSLFPTGAAILLKANDQVLRSIDKTELKAGYNEFTIPLSNSVSNIALVLNHATRFSSTTPYSKLNNVLLIGQ